MVLKRATALFLTLLFCLSLLPAAAPASGEPEAAAYTDDAGSGEPAADELMTDDAETETPGGAEADASGGEAGGEDTSGEEADDADISGEEADDADASGGETGGEDTSGEENGDADTSGEETDSEDASGEETGDEDDSGEEDANADASDEENDDEDASDEDADGEEDESADEEPADEDFDWPSMNGASSLPGDLYLAQEQRGWCTLASCAMMLRARMYLSGSSSWSSITQSGIYSTAWLPGSGVYFNWTWSSGGNSITVSHATVNGLSVGALKSLLDAHPEGIVFYVYDVPHAILVTDYEGNTFYGSDPANASGVGRKPIADTWLGSQLGNSQNRMLNAVDAYWYVSSYNIASTTWYRLSFDPDGGTCGTSSMDVKGGSAIGSLPTPTRNGYVFTGWFTQPGYDGTEVTASSVITQNTTLYAHWQKPNGSIVFSQSPVTIRVVDGAYTAQVTVSGSGSINRVRFDYQLESSAAGKLSAQWEDAGNGTSRTIRLTADPSASGTYHVIFTMYDEESGEAVSSPQTLAVNVISENLYLNIYSTDLVFSAGSAEEQQVDIFYGGASTLPEGYRVECTSDAPGTIRLDLKPFNSFSQPLMVSVDPTWEGWGAFTGQITVCLRDPSGAVCSESVIGVSIYPVSGICGGDELGSVRWDYAGGRLTITAIDSVKDEGYDMWNFETRDGQAPWLCWADEIMRVEIGQGVTRIGSCAFYNCSMLRYVDIADSVRGIEQKAFWGCSYLMSVDVPGSVQFVAADAFHGCSALTKLTFTEGTSMLAAGALDGCSALTTLYVPLSMTDLQMSAGTALQEVFYGGTRLQWQALDTACSIMEKLPSTVQIHTEKDPVASDACAFWRGRGTDANGDGSVDALDAAELLRQVVGLQTQGGGMGAGT